MFAQMRSNQPSEASAGSCFKNPPGDYAGRLIEAVGLKGKKVGNMAFSEVHANFLVNYGGGTFEEAISLIDEAKQRVMEMFNIPLQCEVVILRDGFVTNK
jgi:UDP-N-acetylmuramate dehydrogenase